MVKIPKERLNIQIPTRIKRRLKEVATDKELSMNDVINQAIKDYLDRVDFHHSAPGTSGANEYFPTYDPS